MFKRRFVAASLAACGALLIAACGSGSNNAGETGPIKVGITGPFTGAYADPGIAIRNAGELAIADINAAGGINGRKLEAANADDACDAQQGVQAAQKLLTQKIIAIVGGYCSGASIPESDTLHRNGDLPFITAASSNPKFTDQGYDNVFRMVSRDDAEAPADVSFMQQWLKASKIAIMHDNTTYAKGVADSACADPSVIKVAGTAVTNPGITINTLPTTQFIHNAKNDKFTSAYKAKYGQDPGDYSSYEYDGMMALAQALKDNGGKTEAKSLNTAIHAVKIADGITGNVAFDSKGDRPAPQFLAVHAVGNPPQFQPIAIRQSGTWVAST